MYENITHYTKQLLNETLTVNITKDDIKHETEKAYLINKDDKEFWIQKRWLRKDGTLTDSGLKNYRIAKTTKEKQIEKENKLKKEAEGFKIPDKIPYESEKAYGFDFYVDFYDIEVERKFRVFIPKSMIQENGNIPSWLVRKKIEEVEEQIKTYYSDSAGYWITTPFDKTNEEIIEELKQERILESKMTTFNKEINKKIEDHILYFYSIEELYEEVQREITYNKNYTSYIILKDMVMGGSFLVYNEEIEQEMKNWFGEKYKETNNIEKILNRYAHKIALVGAKMLTEYEKTINKEKDLIESSQTHLKESFLNFKGYKVYLDNNYVGTVATNEVKSDDEMFEKFSKEYEKQTGEVLDDIERIKFEPIGFTTVMKDGIKNTVKHRGLKGLNNSFKSFRDYKNSDDESEYDIKE